MNEHLTSQENFPSQHPYFWDVIKTIMTNAMLLQVLEPATKERRSSVEGLRSLIMQHLPAESHEFSLFPVAPGGCFKNLDRYLLLWCSTSDLGYTSLSPHISSKAVRIIVPVAAKAGFGCFMRDVGKIEHEQLAARCTQSVGSNPAELMDQHLYKIILEGILAVFGLPSAEAQPESDTITPPAITNQENAESSSINRQIEGFNVESDTDTGGKGKERKGDVEVEISGKQLPRDPMDTKQIFGGFGGKYTTFEEALSMTISLHMTKHDKDPFPTVKPVLPPPNDPATPRLRPVTMHSSQPEDNDEPKNFSPLEYTTNIGNASVVHQIYLEARTTGIPRTAEQELIRRHRGCEMVLKEIKDVAQEARRRRNDRGYKGGSWSDVLEELGLEHVPEEEKRKWLLEKQAMVKKRWSECRTTICDNTAATEHLAVVINALYVCKEAGAEGITF